MSTIPKEIHTFCAQDWQLLIWAIAFIAFGFFGGRITKYKK